jgi:hypothetical protein
MLDRPALRPRFNAPSIAAMSPENFPDVPHIGDAPAAIRLPLPGLLAERAFACLVTTPP